MKNLRLLYLVLLFPLFISAQDAKLQAVIDSLRVAGNFPGLSVAIVYKDNTTIAYTSGFNDKEKQLPLKTTDALMQGSVGKTYASAIALKLVEEGKLNLDKKVLEYLGHYSWYSRIPNASAITVRMLMNHTSGVMRYEFKKQFTEDLTANPGKEWKPEELLQYILDEKASFAAGEGWEYSDTNYILLGMIIEKITGKNYYLLVKENILNPLGLHETYFSDKRKLKYLSQGYAGEANEFGGKDKVIDENGLFIINPQFEWTGGGIYSTTKDLAIWGKYLYEGKFVDTSLLFSSAFPAKLGPNSLYALGVIIRNTALGKAYGHSGFFPGYMTELLYFPEKQFSIAVQVNSSDFKSIKFSPLRVLLEVSRATKLWQ